MNHTQDEWKRGGSWGGECVIKTDSVDICNVYDAEAHAKLIAAAPEMLQALQALMKSYESYGQLLNFNINIARQAIKKATK